MRGHINRPLRGMLVIGVALATSATAFAGDQHAIRLAPFLPRYVPPVAASSAEAISPRSTDAVLMPIAPNTTSSVAPAASLSPSEAVVATAVADAPTKSLHHLSGGVSLESQLREWAKSDGWSLTWNVGPDWIVPNDANYVGDFPQAATTVIQDLAANGADVRGDGYLDNRTFVVHEAGND
ncbi:TPA: TcpQ domain-containing protein [Burkholderia orbicola]